MVPNMSNLRCESLSKFCIFVGRKKHDVYKLLYINNLYIVSENKKNFRQFYSDLILNDISYSK